jgi:hypothetical protein
MFKKLTLLLPLALLAALCSCGQAATSDSSALAETSTVSSEPAPEISASPEPESSAPTEPEAEASSEEPELPYSNPLTGEAIAEDISTLRPYAVMMNNIKQALPQSGNAQADLYYELPEEGGITRIMAIFQDLEDVGKIGSIRSTRPYYVQLAYSLDSILVHAGGSQDAYTQISTLGVTDIDSLGKGSQVFYRDQARRSAGYALEHTLYADSDTILNWVSNNSKYRTEHQDSFLARSFHTFVADGTPDNGSAATTVTVPFSGYKTGVFRYDEAQRLYMVEEYNAPYVDEQTGEQIAVTNVIVIQTRIAQISGDSKGRLSIAITGSGSGYYACGGKYIPITWSKEQYSDPYTLKDANGQDISLGVGKTYINIISNSNKVTFE